MFSMFNLVLLNAVTIGNRMGHPVITQNSVDDDNYVMILLEIGHEEETVSNVRLWSVHN